MIGRGATPPTRECYFGVAVYLPPYFINAFLILKRWNPHYPRIRIFFSFSFFSFPSSPGLPCLRNLDPILKACRNLENTFGAAFCLLIGALRDWLSVYDHVTFKCDAKSVAPINADSWCKKFPLIFFIITTWLTKSSHFGSGMKI